MMKKQHQAGKQLAASCWRTAETTQFSSSFEAVVKLRPATLPLQAHCC
jgi:hypothetical protein